MCVTVAARLMWTAVTTYYVEVGIVTPPENMNSEVKQPEMQDYCGESCRELDRLGQEDTEPA
jgi:hypothetical protein